jgi:two-component system OmpR family sensor kinase
MTALVEDLLLLARLDSGRPLEREPVDLTRLLLRGGVRRAGARPRPRWRLELPEDGVEVSGDELRLHQVVTNLLTERPEVHPAGTDGHRAGRTRRVRRTRRRAGLPAGPGRARLRAVRPGRRGAHPRDGTNGTPGGAGLGLALVHAIVNRPRGRRHPGHRPRRHHARRSRSPLTRHFRAAATTPHRPVTPVALAQQEVTGGALGQPKLTDRADFGSRK